MSFTDTPIIMYPAVFGNAGASASLDAVEECVGCVIRFTKSGTLRRIGFRTGTVVAGYTLKVSIETVASTVGQPMATTNAGKTLYVANAESADITSDITANTINYVEINGSTGVSVTAGDLATVTFRLIATTGGGLINLRVATSTLGSEITTAYDGTMYFATYLGSSWTTSALTPLLLLVYSDGFDKSLPLQRPCNANNLTYNSGSTYPYTGIKVSYPFKTRVYGFRFYCDLDGDADLIVYDSDEYTVLAGPISLSNLQRSSTSARWVTVIFSSKLTFNANTPYRVIILAKTTTSVVLNNWTAVDDVSYSGYEAFPEGNTVCLTQRATAPSSGSHVWVDGNDKPHCQMLIDGIEASAGGGGISRSKQVMS